MGVLAEIINVEDGLGMWEIEACKVGIQTGVWGAEVGDSCRRADSCADLDRNEKGVSCINQQARSVLFFFFPSLATIHPASIRE